MGNNYLSKNLRYLRQHATRKGCSQQAFVDAYNALLRGVTIGRSGYNQWELGNAEPSVAHLIVLADFYRVSIDTLLKVDLDRQAQSEAQVVACNEMIEAGISDALELLWVAQVYSSVSAREGVIA